MQILSEMLFLSDSITFHKPFSLPFLDPITHRFLSIAVFLRNIAVCHIFLVFTYFLPFAIANSILKINDSRRDLCYRIQIGF